MVAACHFIVVRPQYHRIIIPAEAGIQAKCLSEAIVGVLEQCRVFVGTETRDTRDPSPVATTLAAVVTPDRGKPCRYAVFCRPELVEGPFVPGAPGDRGVACPCGRFANRPYGMPAMGKARPLSHR